MFYSYNIDLPAAGTEATAVETEMKMGAGVIHQIDIIFPYNQDKDINVRILYQNHALMPTNRLSTLRGHNTVISTREHIPLTAETNLLICQAWNTNASDEYMITVNMGVLSQRILQPFSFQELMAAALGLEE